MSGRAVVVRAAALLVAAGLVTAAACAAPPPAHRRSAGTGDESSSTPTSLSSPARTAAPSPPAGSEPASSSARPSPDSPESRLLAAVNRARARRDLPPLSPDRRLAAAAEEHSRAMAERDFFAHCDLETGSKASTRAEDAGYDWRAIAENLSVGRETADEVVDGWLKSPGHRENLLSPRYRDAGAGYVHQRDDRGNVRVDEDGDCDGDRRDGPYGHYWTMLYGTAR